jgi:hypothetical protein
MLATQIPLPPKITHRGANKYTQNCKGGRVHKRQANYEPDSLAETAIVKYAEVEKAEGNLAKAELDSVERYGDPEAQHRQSNILK